MQISRRFTQDGQDAFAGIPFTPRTSKIVNPNGSVVFEAADVMVPDGWSQVAVDILAQKYFRRAGVPAIGAFAMFQLNLQWVAISLAASVAAVAVCVALVSVTFLITQRQRLITAKIGRACVATNEPSGENRNKSVTSPDHISTSADLAG